MEVQPIKKGLLFVYVMKVLWKNDSENRHPAWFLCLFLSANENMTKKEAAYDKKNHNHFVSYNSIAFRLWLAT